MARVKRGVTSHAKHKKVLKAVKGQWGRRKNTIRVARQAMEKAMQYAYRDRRNKKRDFKSLWIQRINAGVRAEGGGLPLGLTALCASEVASLCAGGLDQFAGGGVVFAIAIDIELAVGVDQLMLPVRAL